MQKSLLFITNYCFCFQNKHPSGITVTDKTNQGILILFFMSQQFSVMPRLWHHTLSFNQYYGVLLICLAHGYNPMPVGWEPRTMEFLIQSPISQAQPLGPQSGNDLTEITCFYGNQTQLTCLHGFFFTVGRGITSTGITVADMTNQGMV